VFKLLLTVFLGICVGAVVADLLFGPDQPATPNPDSQGQHWEPWRSWYLAARDQSRRALAAVLTWVIGAAQAVDRGARRLATSTVAAVRLVPDTVRSMGARRRAMAERTAAHARHVAHLEAVTPRHDPLPPPVAPPMHPGWGPPMDQPARSDNGADVGAEAEAAIAAAAATWGETGVRSVAPGETDTFETDTFEPLGRPPWDALVRRPTPGQAATPRADGPRGAATRARKKSRRDPLDWMPKEAERRPDPEWDEGVPVPLIVPMRVRARSGAVLLALTGVFGIVTATAVLLVVVMAVGALDKL
jgi:hypothetical protein